MKIIVDKMPNEPEECIFSECTNQLRGNYVCDLHQGRGCEPNKCDFLKPMIVAAVDIIRPDDEI